jgi:hypothetical protein
VDDEIEHGPGEKNSEDSKSGFLSHEGSSLIWFDVVT